MTRLVERVQHPIDFIINRINFRQSGKTTENRAALYRISSCEGPLSSNSIDSRSVPKRLQV